MSKARNILKRAKTVMNIRAVTKTMELVAAARHRQVAEQARGLRAYAERSAEMVVGAIARADERIMAHPLIRGNEQAQRDVLVVLTSDRGLCGGYDAAVVREAVERIEQLTDAGSDVRLHVVGRKGERLLRRGGREIEAAYTDFGHAPKFDQVCELIDGLIERFCEGEIRGVAVACTRFVSGGVQKPAVVQLLPLAQGAPSGEGADGPAAAVYEFLPDEDEILDQLLPASVRVRAYQCFMDAAVCEQIARMRAMRAATDNADDMIHDLTARYNRTRQGQITDELAEIIAGSEGVRG